MIESSRIGAILNHKGGVGKTTLTLNVASILSEESKVLIVDADSQMNSTNNLLEEPQPKPTLFDLFCEENITAKDAIVPSRLENIYVIQGDKRLSRLSEANIYDQVTPQTVLKSKLKSVLSFFDYILIDAPPAMNIIVTCALVSADAFIIPTELNIDSAEGVSRIYSLAKSICKSHLGTPKSAGILISKFEKGNSNEVKRFIEELENTYEGDVLPVRIPHSIKVLEATNARNIVCDMFPNHSSTKAYRKVSQHIKEFLR